MAISAKELIKILNNLFPRERSEPGDKVGLQIEPEAEQVERILLALDPGREVLKEAIKQQAELVLTHHPLFYKPVFAIGREDVSRAFIRAGIGLFVSHTNFDRDFLAPAWGRIFQLKNVRPIGQGDGEQLFKIVIFIPEGHEEKVSRAIFSRGAGHIGKYDQTSFQTGGSGTFRPQKGAQPFIGREGQREEVREIRLETIVPARFLGGVVQAIEETHPYEEVAYDLYPLANKPASGLGIIGDLPNPLKQRELADLMIEEGLGANLRWGRTEDRLRQKLALVPGKGGKLLPEGIAQGAEIFVSGDIDYHQFQMGQEKDVLIADPGHFHLEIKCKGILKDILGKKLPGVELIPSQRELCPYYHEE